GNLPLRPLDCQYARQYHLRIPKSIRQPQTARHFRRQLKSWRPNRSDYDLRSRIQPVARIIERVDRRLRVKMQIPCPIGPPQQMLEECPNVMYIELRIVVARHDQQKFGERQLPLTENRVRLSEQF